MKIMCSDPKAQYLKHQKKINKAIFKVLKSGNYILGKETKTLEMEFAKYNKSKYAISVGSGTDALFIALKACDIGSGDEVITVSHTAVATVAAIELCQAKPVLVDIEADYYTIDPKKIKKAISKKTKAIIIVHLYGQAADIKPILNLAKNYNCKVIEDCCQAHGAEYHQQKVGSWGDVSCFSFYPTKNLGAIGDGGMIVTNNGQIADKCRLLREYGWQDRYISKICGLNSRLDEVQAAILRIKLPYLDKENLKRHKIAQYYQNHLNNTGLILPKERKNSFHAYHLFVVRSKQRDKLISYLKNKNIYSLIHYQIPIHLQPAYVNRFRLTDSLNETIKAAQEVISLPMYPELTTQSLKYIVKTIKTFYSKS